MHRYRKRPANMLISAILASIMFIIIANSFMNLWGNSFTTLTAAKTATQAQAYSDIVSEKIKLEGTDAEEVTTKTKLSLVYHLFHHINGSLMAKYLENLYKQ